MAALLDTENFEMPVDERNDPMFTAEFWVAHPHDGIEHKTAEIHITVPEYMEGASMLGQEFLYNSCGYLYASLDNMVDDFIDDYRKGLTDLEDVIFFRQSLENLVSKLNAAVPKDEGK